MFDTKFAIVVRDDLETWQKLNVTAFLTSGVVGNTPDIMGVPYEDAAGNRFHSLSIQPCIVLSAEGNALGNIHRPRCRVKSRQPSTLRKCSPQAMMRPIAPCSPNMVRTMPRSWALRYAVARGLPTRLPRMRNCTREYYLLSIEEFTDFGFLNAYC